MTGVKKASLPTSNYGTSSKPILKRDPVVSKTAELIRKSPLKKPDVLNKIANIKTSA